MTSERYGHGEQLTLILKTMKQLVKLAEAIGKIVGLFIILAVAIFIIAFVLHLMTGVDTQYITGHPITMVILFFVYVPTLLVMLTED